MRLPYILVLVIVATLHANGNAFSTDKGFNHVAISNVASTDATQEDRGRFLQVVGKDDENEIEEEERSFNSIGKALKKFTAKHLPFIKSWKIAREAKKNKLRVGKLWTIPE
ncbi:RxLR effector protein Avh23 [Phytophthora ramorum]|uniref:RxLR effector protein Avh23 n=1 Tax=Phytophthora ramorum TaxID=164328 RepID=UPI0030A5E8BB|nr:RxLR effector protein Avh23 [Phytophthora ramorum]